MTKPVKGRIENWIKLPWGTAGHDVIMGDLYESIEGQPEGVAIRTSWIVSISDDEVETRNSIYKLGKPA